MKVKDIGHDGSRLSVLKNQTYEYIGKEHSMFRVIDETDEDYLYPCEDFEFVPDES